MVVEEGAYRGFGTPLKMSRTPGGLRTVPPDFGQDTRAVLADAGFSPDEIEALVAEGIALEGKK